MSRKRFSAMRLAAFERVAAVDGLALSERAREMLAELGCRGASPVEMVVAVFTANSRPGSVHVVPHRKGWAVRSSGATKAEATFATHADALTRARKIAKARGREVMVHREDGSLARREVP